MQVDTRRPGRQDTFDLRDQIHGEGMDQGYGGSTDEEEHSVLEDDSDGEDRDDYLDEEDDESSVLSIPNESIDFDLVYAFHSFAATVEGQANVVKGDSLFLMDDSNSYWWLVRVLKTQEVGYIPAENIETPFERLARLNKHRNVDLSSATQAELQDSFHASQDRLRTTLGSRQDSNQSPSPSSNQRRQSPGRRTGRSITFQPEFVVTKYLPAIWKEEDEELSESEYDLEGYEGIDEELLEDVEERKLMAEENDRRMDVDPPTQQRTAHEMMASESDDGMGWEDPSVEENRVRMAAQARAAAAQQQTYVQQQQREQATPQQQTQPLGAPVRPPRTTASLGPEAADAAPAGDINAMQQSSQSQGASQPQSQRQIDIAEITETRKLTVTPTIARDSFDDSANGPPSQQPLGPSAILAKQQEEERVKRAREEEQNEEARKRLPKTGKDGKPLSLREIAPPVSSSQYQRPAPNGGKLRKERERVDSTASSINSGHSSSTAVEDNLSDSAREKKEKKKSGSMFSSIFGGRKKDKDKKEKSSGSIDLSDGERGRASQDDRNINRAENAMSPVTVTAMQQQQQQALNTKRLTQQGLGVGSRDSSPQGSNNPFTNNPNGSGSIPGSPQVSGHAAQLRQRDQQQQALYQQYLNRSPSSPPESLQPNYGLQSASAVLQSSGPSSYSGIGTLPNSTSPASGLHLTPPQPRARPGSLILSPSATEGPGVPDLSVIRIFAGKNLQTEATFKTVLLNSTITSQDLIKQAIQRFRLQVELSGEARSGRDSAADGDGHLDDYYLTIKQVEGGSTAILTKDEKPLVVFESLVREREEMELPKVKRSSVGSISSVTSNLSMLPAIRKLDMNDFTDDSAVKFYLNRRRRDDPDDSFEGNFAGDETLTAVDNSVSLTAEGSDPFLSVHSPVTDRFSSPSYRFVMQLVVYPQDLPDDMVFDTHTEAIIFKDNTSSRERNRPPPSSISQAMRRKVFIFPRNVTVAEVIELGLERFGILEGVVDGGDEIEDKLNKRTSVGRVRYGLSVAVGNNERELSMPSRVIEAFPRPPQMKTIERVDNKRRSVDSAQLLGSLDDINPEDPIFILRRAKQYKSSTSRHRLSAPLDELALANLHRESTSSYTNSEASTVQQSKQEIIEAQRAARRDNQRAAILSAQANSVRGLDVVLPGNVVLRSSRYEVDDRMRYSYVDTDGETYDISDIIEEEWTSSATGSDVLEGVIGRDANNEVVGQKLDRVLSKIKTNRQQGGQQTKVTTAGGLTITERTASPNSDYHSEDGTLEAAGSRSVTPGSAVGSRAPANAATAVLNRGNSAQGQVGRGTPLGRSSPAPGNERSGTPVGAAGGPGPPGPRSQARRNPSVASVASEPSGQGARSATPTSAPQRSMSVKNKKAIESDFGVGDMLALIHWKAQSKKPPSKTTPLEPADALLFGRDLDLDSLHPKLQSIYKPVSKQFEDIDKYLDDCLMSVRKL